MTILSSLKNKMPVLDKGFVTLLSSTFDSADFVEVQNQFFSGKISTRLTDINHICFLVKCPLFVQLALSDLGLRSFSQKQNTIEFYEPNVSEISASSVNISIEIEKHMKSTADAVIMNAKNYQLDGADVFVSQVNSPLSVYNVLMVTGSMTQFLTFCNKKELPRPIESYRKTIQDIIKGNWNSSWELLDEDKRERSKH